MKVEEKFFLGALIGSALGAAIALLFTPQSGENLRKRILTNFYQPLKIPKRKIFSQRRARPLSKRKTPKPHAEDGKEDKESKAKKSIRKPLNGE